MQNAILRTIAYFDLFDFPLTELEVWKFLRKPEAVSFSEVQTTLEELHETQKLETQCGFWFVSGRADHVRVRQERYLIAERKYKKVLQAVRWLKWIPGIRLIAVANTLAWSHAREGSDLDLFIITRPGRLWLSRFLAVVPFMILGLRPRRNRERDTFCFSFFATERSLDFSSLRVIPEDPYFLYWLTSLFPLYDPDGLLEAVWEMNPWLQTELPQAWSTIPNLRRRLSGRKTHGDIEEARSGWLEMGARALQLLWLPETLSGVMNVDERVIVTDEILKFHENDRRRDICERYQKRCRELCV